MKVFVITNQALYYDSSYFDVVAVTKTLESARAVVGTCKKDFLEGVDNRYYNPTFTEFSNLDIEEQDLQLCITDKSTGFYEKFVIEELELL